VQARSIIVHPDGSPFPQAQRVIDAALVPTPNLTITLVVGSAPCSRSCTADDGTHTIWLTRLDAPTLLHEVGHQFDYLMPDTTRAAFVAIMHDGRAWRSAPSSPHEQFAETYRLCAEHGNTSPHAGGDGGGYAYAPTLAQHRAVCALIRSTATTLGFTPAPPLARPPAKKPSTAKLSATKPSAPEQSSQHHSAPLPARPPSAGAAPSRSRPPPRARRAACRVRRRTARAWTAPRREV
jgi:hypothetical protein